MQHGRLELVLTLVVKSSGLSVCGRMCVGLGDVLVLSKGGRFAIGVELFDEGEFRCEGNNANGVVLQKLGASDSGGIEG